MHFSLSQIKQYLKSPSQWAGKYILGIQDKFEQDALLVGKAFHRFFETGNKDEAYLLLEGVKEKEKSVEQLDCLISNFLELIPQEQFNEMLKLTVPESRKEFDLMGYPFVAYFDKLQKDGEEGIVYELKSSSSLTMKNGPVPMWSSMCTYDEYELQAWVYMKATGYNRVIFIECLKKKFKTKNEPGQVFDFKMNEELESRMTEKYKPIIDEMFGLISKFNIKTDSELTEEEV